MKLEILNMFNIHDEKPCCVEGDTEDSGAHTLWTVTQNGATANQEERPTEEGGTVKEIKVWDSS